MDRAIGRDEVVPAHLLCRPTLRSECRNICVLPTPQQSNPISATPRQALQAFSASALSTEAMQAVYKSSLHDYRNSTRHILDAISPRREIDDTTCCSCSQYQPTDSINK
ncbi:uncharacterized protein MYCGRDRAFT_97831 [Zymoseptoria tritici IPO323]|uniref:Uncharacterized protein n=1 Tax=Zymoseptoria tritici (strain CBS 115943 / IPO323) TaxID=336722 RepID=F9XRI2_ZYMTI|nr:uncharacterized protein MYCGRDRAFT_97831 [Zymoseptoria tritici IPO323]EGP82140.1 hypothetical protein MYCGRDRAFT_97831 [Zymoseptoria tritici IPO323]